MGVQTVTLIQAVICPGLDKTSWGWGPVRAGVFGLNLQRKMQSPTPTLPKKTAASDFTEGWIFGKKGRRWLQAPALGRGTGLQAQVCPRVRCDCGGLSLQVATCHV